MFVFLMMMFACGDKVTLQCTEDVLQECDADGNCTDVQDCAADGMMCHDMGEDSHCMEMNTEEDSGMDM